MRKNGSVTKSNCYNVTIKQGDNSYSSIAAASILAKTERDTYIDNLCDKFPELDLVIVVSVA